MVVRTGRALASNNGRSIDFGSSFKDDISGWQLQSDSAGSNVFFQFSAGKRKKSGAKEESNAETHRDIVVCN